MNIEVQSTERIQRPQLLRVVRDILRLVVLRPAWYSLLTIAVVRVQGPRATSALPFTLHCERHNGTFLRTLDTLPKRKRLLLFLLELMVVYCTASEALRTAA